MDVLVLLVVVQILPVGENLPAALEVTEEDFTFRCFPDSFGADLGHVLIARPHWLLTAAIGKRGFVLGSSLLASSTEPGCAVGSRVVYLWVWDAFRMCCRVRGVGRQP